MLGNVAYRGELPDVHRLEAMLHEHNRDRDNENYREDKKLPGETERLPIGMLRNAGLTANKGLGTIHGIQATVITLDRGVTLRAHAPESQWKNFKPVFYRILDGINRVVKKNGRCRACTQKRDVHVADQTNAVSFQKLGFRTSEGSLWHRCSPIG